MMLECRGSHIIPVEGKPIPTFFCMKQYESSIILIYLPYFFFYTGPDPLITEVRIPIWILIFSSLAFKMPKKLFLSAQTGAI
jgi:hypothetical protein